MQPNNRRMWGKVWALPLCTVIVAILSAPSASGCTCGGPDTPTNAATMGIDPLLCGVEINNCDAGEVCICDYDVVVDVDTSALIAGTGGVVVTWYCAHEGNNGYCTSK